MSDLDGAFRMKRLVLMMGLPYSGKSTAAEVLSAALGAPIVCPDEIRRSLHGQRYAQEAEPLVWYMARVMVRALFLAGHDYVILDATNTTKERRDEWRGSEGWWVQVFEIDIAPLICKRRAEAEGDEEIVPVITRMSNRYEGLHDTEDRLRVDIPIPGPEEEEEDDG